MLTYKSGKSILVTYALSHSPLPETSCSEQVSVNNHSFRPIKRYRRGEIRVAIERVESLSCLKNTIVKGWPPNKDAVPNSMTLYFCYRDEQTVQDGIILRGERVVIPAATRPYIKVKLHAGHRELTHIYAELENWYSGLACRAKFDNTWIHAKNARSPWSSLAKG